MKKIIAILLILTLVLPLTACDSADGMYFTCEEITAAYESAGYMVENSHSSYIEGGICSLSIYKSKEGYEKHDYICFEIFENDEYAKAYNDEMRFNVATWLVFAMCGEPRWLHTERYGNVHVEYYPRKFLKPFSELLNTK